MDHSPKYCILCQLNRKGDTNRKGHAGYRCAKPVTLGVMQMIQRQSKSNQPVETSPLAARDVFLEAEYPNVTEYLTSRTFADGSERETATLLVFAADGLWKVCLNDRAEERSLWASGASYADALAALETMLDTASGEWRRSQPRKTSKRS